MSKSVPGDPKKDQAVKKWLEHTRRVFNIKNIYKNLSQEMLREIARTTNHIAGEAWFHCDYRNEQGRGGLSASRRKKK